MSTALDVLLLEASPGDGSADAALLEAAGHRVRHCLDPDHPHPSRHPSGLVPCLALTDGTCPLDDGIDVAVLVRRGVVPQPGPGESGIRCAVRAGVPVVEDGTDLLDPWSPWITGRTSTSGVVEACEVAARGALTPALEELHRITEPLFDGTDVDPTAVSAGFEVDGDHLTVRLQGPPLADHVLQAVSVRVVDAVRVLPRRFSTVDVSWIPDES